MTIQLHDFTRPPSLHPETRAKLAQWLSRSSSLLSEVIAGFSIKVDVKMEDCITALPAKFLPELSDQTIATRVKLADLTSQSIIAVPNSLAQVIVGSMMGEQFKSWPEERSLTPGESSLCDLFVSNIVHSLVESWPSDSPLKLSTTDREPNLRRTKIFKITEPFVVCRCTVTSEIGAAPWSWILPHEFLTELFGSIATKASAPGVSARQQLEALARDMTTQVTIRLGGVQLSAPQVAALRVGDLVVLNQKTTEPLRAIVSGKPKYLGWPGRVGNRQAFEIASETSRRDRSAEAAKDTAATVSR